MEITEPRLSLTLPPCGYVDLWVAWLGDADPVGRYRLTRRADRARLMRIVPATRRRRFLFKRAVQHHVLGRYLRSYRIGIGPNGKPSLARSPAPAQFSVSASGQFCAVAVSACDVGIDIVANSVGVDLTDLCSRFVPGYALATADLRSDMARHRAAMWSWSRFESTIKLGGGSLYEALARPRLDAAEPHWDAVVTDPRYVCAVANAVPFRIARFVAMPFTELCAHAR